jgi:hypothetical protein
VVEGAKPSDRSRVVDKIKILSSWWDEPNLYGGVTQKCRAAGEIYRSTHQYAKNTRPTATTIIEISCQNPAHILLNRQYTS